MCTFEYLQPLYYSVLLCEMQVDLLKMCGMNNIEGKHNYKVSVIKGAHGRAP